MDDLNIRDPFGCFSDRMPRGGIIQDKILENCLFKSLRDSIRIQHRQVKWPWERRG